MRDTQEAALKGEAHTQEVVLKGHKKHTGSSSEGMRLSREAVLKV